MKITPETFPNPNLVYFTSDQISPQLPQPILKREIDYLRILQTHAAHAQRPFEFGVYSAGLFARRWALQHPSQIPFSLTFSVPRPTQAVVPNYIINLFSSPDQQR